jgi:4'-phosphopantetheinyl transferase EntD
VSGGPALLARLLPSGVCVAETEDRGQAIVLPAPEQALTAVAGEKRVRDFALGRDCAHRALGQLGADAGPILQHASGAPRWPDGIVGSITHTSGYAAAAVAPAALFAGIGIDAERITVLKDNVARRLFAPEERTWLDGLSPGARDAAAILLFSAKEAYFKACAPVAFRFTDVRVEAGEGGFRVSAGDFHAEGRWATADDLVVTAIALAMD